MRNEHRSKLFLIVMLVAFFLLTTSIFYVSMPKQAYVNYEQLFQGFKGKQELGQQLDLLKGKHQGILDSLTIEINTMQVRRDPQGMDSVARKQAFYEALLRDFSQVQAQEADLLTAKIWLQINQYMSDYGKEEGYDYIFRVGMENGGIAYGKAQDDITAQVLLYLNKRYEGN